MRRRSFVAGLSVGAIPVTGCIAPDGGDRPSTDATASSSRTADVSAPPIDASFPPNGDDVDEVVWHRQLSDPDDALVLEPSRNSAPVSGGELSFTLCNGTDRTFQTNFYGWGLYRWERERWHHVAPTSVPQPLTPLSAGEDHDWTLRVNDADLSQTSFRVQGSSELSIGALGGGTYAFAIDGWWPEQPATPTHEHKTMRAALFTLEDEPLALEPSDAVTDVQRDGGVVVVSATNETAAETDDDRPVTFALTADESVSDPNRFVTEQIYRAWPLRDALAYADADVTEVRVETTTTGRPPFHVLSERSPLAYDGRTYRISSTEGHE